MFSFEGAVSKGLFQCITSLFFEYFEIVSVETFYRTNSVSTGGPRCLEWDLQDEWRSSDLENCILKHFKIL